MDVKKFDAWEDIFRKIHFAFSQVILITHTHITSYMCYDKRFDLDFHLFHSTFLYCNHDCAKEPTNFLHLTSLLIWIRPAMKCAKAGSKKAWMSEWMSEWVNWKKKISNLLLKSLFLTNKKEPPSGKSYKKVIIIFCLNLCPYSHDITQHNSQQTKSEKAMTQTCCCGCGCCLFFSPCLPSSAIHHH